MNDGILQFSHKTYGFGGRFLKIRVACMDFELCFKVYNLVSIHSKITKLSQMTTLNMIFLVLVYRLVQIWSHLIEIKLIVYYSLPPICTQCIQLLCKIYTVLRKQETPENRFHYLSNITSWLKK